MAGNGRGNARAKAAQMLAAGHSIASTAKDCGVSERTVFRWLQEDDFRAQVDRFRADAWTQAASVLGTASTKAAATLAKLLDDKSPWVRLHAARAILEAGTKLREELELEQRISELEAAIGDKKGQSRWGA